MKKVLQLVILVSVLLIPGSLCAQDEMMQAWQEYMTPGAMHQMLAKSVGEWKTEMKMWMDPTQPPVTSEGTAICETLFDGRYFQTKHQATFMGMPFSGVDLSGYDNVKKKFFSTWIDNMGTGVMYLEGTYDEATQSTTFTGTMMDPMGKEVQVREVFKHIDDDNMSFEMFNTMDGKEFKSMEMKLIRKKS